VMMMMMDAVAGPQKIEPMWDFPKGWMQPV
jgi:hypothetical protein